MDSPLSLAWQRLAQHYEQSGRSFDLRQAFAQDPARFEAAELFSALRLADGPLTVFDLQRLRRQNKLPARAP